MRPESAEFYTRKAALGAAQSHIPETAPQAGFAPDRSIPDLT